MTSWDVHYDGALLQRPCTLHFEGSLLSISSPATIGFDLGMVKAPSSLTAAPIRELLTWGQTAHHVCARGPMTATLYFQHLCPKSRSSWRLQ